MAQIRRTKEEWIEIVREYRRSGKTLKEWCAVVGVNYKTMSSYLHFVPSKKTARSDQEWIDLFMQQRFSGLGITAWCNENGINPNAMSSAKKRLGSKLEAAFGVLEEEPEAKDANLGEQVSSNESREVTHDFKEDRACWVEVQLSESCGIDTAMSIQADAPKAFAKCEATVVCDESDQNLAEKHKRSACESEEATFSLPNKSDSASPNNHIQNSKIIIRYGKLEMEADAGYPLGHLENLIGKLVVV